MRLLPLTQAQQEQVSHCIGWCSEYVVAKYFLNSSFELSAHRYRCKAFELDLVLQKKSFHKHQIILCEVKSISQWSFMGQRLSKRQKQRLQNAFLSVEAKYPKASIEFRFCFVEWDTKVKRDLMARMRRSASLSFEQQDSMHFYSYLQKLSGKDYKIHFFNWTEMMS